MKLLERYWQIFTKLEKCCLLTAFFMILLSACILHDSKIAVFNAFFGIMYTSLAGKGKVDCFYFGLAGSALYCILAFSNNLWGNLLLYALYYIPMQILGIFKWNKNLDTAKDAIIKTQLNDKEHLLYGTATLLITVLAIFVLYLTGDNSPVFDGITTIFSILGMILTVGRKIEQWIIWMTVNGLSAIMWMKVALQGENVYSTVIMWIVYFILAVNFYLMWKKELKQNA
ncbi:nicotinamide mononucleotide transporter [bacterium]|nr:nicotinamide mononucleotide transporter [bacterium]